MSRTIDPTTAWLRAAGSRPLLTTDEVIVLSRLVQAWKRGEVSERVGIRALNRLVSGNLRLVARVWRSHFSWVQATEPRLPDLLQEGAMGLREAALKYDSGRGYTFATYAVNWIRKGMVAYMRDRDRGIRVSGDCFAVVNTARKFIGETQATEGRTPSVVEIAARVKKPLNTVSFYLDRFTITEGHSLNIKASEDGKGAEIIAFVEARDEYSMQDDARGEKLARILDILFDAAQCDEQERTVIRERYLRAIPTSYAKIGEMIGVRGSQVRPIHQRVMNHLVKAADASGFTMATILCRA
jgi:RNA polymerase sigma factor (sigma-70 family)